MINCELLCHSNSIHLQQIYTGFRILDRKRAISAKQIIRKTNLFDLNKPPHLRDAKLSHLKVTINNKVAVYYDMHDSHEIDTDIINEVDFYFKRSYLKSEVDRTNTPSNKIYPYGLNYLVHDSRPDMFALRRAQLETGVEKLKTAIRASIDPRVFPGSLFHIPRANNCFSFPNFNLPPKVLFMARAWNPKEAPSKEKEIEFEKINSIRAKCIRLLRKELGEKYFFGGFARDSYSTSVYNDCLLPNGDMAKQRKYLKILKEFPICVATKGLHNSIGWKFGEYVAHSKAIVAEHLNFEVPGKFYGGNNFLEFKCPEHCVELCIELVKNKALRSRLMAENYHYYNNALKPDLLIFNTLLIALGLA